MKERATLNFFLEYFMNNQLIVAIIFLLIGWFVIQIRDILLLLFTSYIIMAALLPFVGFLRGFKIPKILAIFIAYFTTIAVILLLILPLIPFFASQIQSLFLRFPSYFQEAVKILRIQPESVQVESFFTSQFEDIGRNAFALTSKIFGGFFSSILVLVLSFYLLIDHDKIRKNIVGLFSQSIQKNVQDTIAQMEEKLGAWVRGQALLSLLIGALTWVALTFLGLEFALPLAILAGILEVIPTIGPILSAIPAVIVSLAVSPASTIGVIIAYIIIQALENNFIVPKVMQRSVGLNPILVIIGITIGTKLMGIFGGLLSIPFLSMLIILFNSFKNYERD